MYKRYNYFISKCNINYVISEVLTATPCNSYDNRRFGGTYCHNHRGLKNWLILFILVMDAIRSSETSVLTKVIPLHIQEDGILQILTNSIGRALLKLTTEHTLNFIRKLEFHLKVKKIINLSQ
jgi:hypothetical protein